MACQNGGIGMKVSHREKAAYGFGAVGKDMVYCLVSAFLMYYYNEILGISSTFIGVLFMCARIFDAVNDPMMGIVVEKTNTKFGKFRPWLFVGTLANALILFAMFAIPTGVKGTPLLVYASVAYILWGMTYTIMDIPYWSIIPAITESGKDRENMSVIARSCAGVGFAIPTAITLTAVRVLGNGNERLGFAIFAGIVAVFFVVAISTTVFNLKEKPVEVEKSASIKEMFQSLISNDQALVVVVSIIIFNASLYITQTLGIYFFKYQVGNEELFGIFGTVGGAAQILSMCTLPLLRKKFECKKILIGAVMTTLFGYACFFALSLFNVTNMIVLCIVGIIIFFGFGLATVLTTVFLADTVDYGEWKNNQRNESVIFSLQTFVVKLASAVSGLIAGVGLDIIKLNKTAKVQTASTIAGLRVLMAIIPMCGLVVAIAFFARKYKLDEKALETMKEDLKNRRN